MTHKATWSSGFGLGAVFTAEPAPADPAGFEPVGFGGQFGYYKDYATGLYLLGHRYYDARAGRFLNRDPLGYGGGINLYGFTANNPVNRQDPEGTDDFTYGVTAAGVQLFGNIARPYVARAKPYVDRYLYYYNKITDAGLMDTSATTNGHPPVLPIFRAVLKQKAGFGGTGQPYIMDTNVERSLPRPAPGQPTMVETMRAQGYNVRSVTEMFGRDPGDNKIRQIARQIGAKVITKDKGTDIGGGFGDLADSSVSKGLRHIPENDTIRILRFLTKVLPK